MRSNTEKLFCQALDIDLSLTPERWEHIVTRHPEILQFEIEFKETIFRPDYLLKKPTEELLLVKWHPQIFSGKFVVVVVRQDKMRPWIITAFLSRSKPYGNYYEV